MSPKPCWRRPRPVVTGGSWRRTIFCGGRSARRRGSQRPWCTAPTVSGAAREVGVLGRPCIWGSIRSNRTGGQLNSGVQRYNLGYINCSAWQKENYVVFMFNKNVRIAAFFIVHYIWVLILVHVLVGRSVTINCLFQLLRGHDDHVITCLEFCGSRVVSGSDDNTLKVWSVITGKVCNHSQTFSVACLIDSSSLIDYYVPCVKHKYCKVHIIGLQ